MGTDADWAAGAAQAPSDELLDRIVAVGFRGLVLDRRAYRDSVREYSLAQVAGAPTFESRDGSLAFYDLRDHARALRTRVGAQGIRALRAEAFCDHGRPKRAG